MTDLLARFKRLDAQFLLLEKKLFFKNLEGWDDDILYLFHERAAELEYCHDMSREDAETEARKQVLSGDYNWIII